MDSRRKYTDEDVELLCDSLGYSGEFISNYASYEDYREKHTLKQSLIYFLESYFLNQYFYPVDTVEIKHFIFNTSLEKMPVYINDDNMVKKKISIWRLKIGK